VLTSRFRSPSACSFLAKGLLSRRRLESIAAEAAWRRDGELQLFSAPPYEGSAPLYRA
jgi:hypothetical protein